MNQNVVSDVYLLIAIEVIDCIGGVFSSHLNGLIKISSVVVSG